MAKPTELQRHDAQDRDLGELQDRLAEFAQQVSECPLLVGNTVEDIAIVAGTPETVYHKLDRTPEGWLVVRRSASAVVFESGTFDATEITLDASANVTVTVWVY